jgi:hypothetical protein
VAIANVSGTSIDGPLYLVADGLASGVTLANSSGIVANVPPAGVPYVTVLRCGSVAWRRLEHAYAAALVDERPDDLLFGARARRAGSAVETARNVRLQL